MPERRGERDGRRELADRADARRDRREQRVIESGVEGERIGGAVILGLSGADSASTPSGSSLATTAGSSGGTPGAPTSRSPTP
jgi:hypothetical protein